MTTISKVTCTRCKYKWYPKLPKLPKQCTNCKSPYWNKKRINKRRIVN